MGPFNDIGMAGGLRSETLEQRLARVGARNRFVAYYSCARRYIARLNGSSWHRSIAGTGHEWSFVYVLGYDPKLKNQ